MNISTEVVNSFNEAVINPENIRDGLIDWNYVDSDVFMDMKDVDHLSVSDINDQLDYLITQYEQQSEVTV